MAVSFHRGTRNAAEAFRCFGSAHPVGRIGSFVRFMKPWAPCELGSSRLSLALGIQEVGSAAGSPPCEGAVPAAVPPRERNRRSRG